MSRAWLCCVCDARRANRSFCRKFWRSLSLSRNPTTTTTTTSHSHSWAGGRKGPAWACDVVTHPVLPEAQLGCDAWHDLLTSTRRLSRRRSRASTISQNGTLTVHRRVRRPATTPMSTSDPSHTTPTPSVWVTTSSSCARRTCQTARPTPTTSVTTPP